MYVVSQITKHVGKKGYSGKGTVSDSRFYFAFSLVFALFLLTLWLIKDSEMHEKVSLK